MPDDFCELTSEEILLNIDVPETDGTDDRKWAVVGQDRAVQALEMGLSIRAKGYNIYVAGEPGTGKHTAIKDILKRHLKKDKPLRDIAYVQDFQEPDKPAALMFSEGRARVFKEDLKSLTERLKKRIVQDLDAKAYKEQRDKLIAGFENDENKVFSQFESQLKEQGFALVRTEDEEDGQDTDIVPVIGDEVVPFDELQIRVQAGQLPEEVWKDKREQFHRHADELNRIFRDMQVKQEKLEQTLETLKSGAIRTGIRRECAETLHKWPDAEHKNYLESLEQDVLENCDRLISDDEELEIRYGINIIVDRSDTGQLPVIREINPTRVNLFGAIEARYDLSGEVRTSMMMIKAGSLLEADGGYLVLQAEDLFARESLWPELKRALETGHVVPEVQSTALGQLPVLMKPRPVKTETTVILVGAAHIYESLCAQDDVFLKLFKVAAEFSPFMVRTPETEYEYTRFVHSLAAREGLLPVSNDGVREIISYGVLLAEKRNLLSTRFSLIGDLIRESHYAAVKSSGTLIDGPTVRKAIAVRNYLGNLPEENLIDQIREETLLVDTKGTAVGTVNGLAVLERGFYAFGTPLRITATVSPGKDGLINIERESGLSGGVHDKGVLLLEGYLRHRYARRLNLSLTAGIAVEQSYYEIDGDSASAAELAALLSAIAELPLRQDIAVTGAVNQQGTILPVGGIHEKVRGFFRTCRAKGLTGTQGVIVPVRNTESVILSDEVTEAVGAGQFHIWTAGTIDGVMTALSGIKAGGKRRNGRFTANSVNEKVRQGLTELAELS